MRNGAPQPARIAELQVRGDAPPKGAVTRNRVLLAIVLLLVVLRIALPYVLRPLIVSQADEALIGRVELADLDLSLIRGGVTLHGLELHTNERPEPGAAEPPPIFEAKQLWTNISWLALLRKTVEIEDFELEGFQVRLDREADGLVLPEPRQSAKPEPPPETPPEPSGWSFAADNVALRDGGLHFTDYTVGETPERFDFDVRDLSARELALVVDPTGREPGHVRIEAKIGEGSIDIDSVVESRREGPAATTKITLVNLPIGNARRYLRFFGWSRLAARLDAEIEHRFESAGAHSIGGHVALSQLEVDVPDLARPALRFDRLDVDLDTIDLEKRHAAVSKVVLVAPRVAVDPRARPVLPLLAPLPAPARAATTPAPAEASPAWTWSVGDVKLERGVVELGIPDPIELGVDVEVQKLSSEPARRWPLRVAVTEGAGRLGVDGALAIEPVAFDGKLSMADFALPPLLARVDAPGVRLVRKGDARADLAIALSSDLRVSGTLGLANLDVSDPTMKEFAASWKDFELGIREISLADALGKGDPAKRAIAVKLDRVRLAEPDVSITRTKDGIALPPLGGSAEAKSEAPPAPAEAKAEAPAAAGSPLSVEIADLRLEKARAAIADKSVTPFYRGRIDRLDVRAHGVRWPERRVDSLVASMKGLQGATLDVRGRIAPGGSKLEAKLVELPLGPFNPYVTPTGYSLAGGTLSLETKAEVGREDYDASTDVRVHRLELGGAKGESLFQENFGIPLSVALGLLKDLNGDITLSVPVAGDRAGTRVGLGTIVGQALRKALLGALAAPLKLLGAVTADGRVQLAPEPIAFTAGTAALAPEGDARIETVAGLLAASPGIVLTLHGAVSPADVRALQEEDLLAELRDAWALGTKRAVRRYLEARAKGEEPGALDADEQAWLDEEASKRVIAPERLTALCEARAKTAQQALVSDHGIAAGRLVLGAPRVDPTATLPSVALALGADAAGAGGAATPLLPQVGADKADESK